MGHAAADLASYSFALAALVHAAFALHLVRNGSLQDRAEHTPRVFFAAIVATAAWAVCSLADLRSNEITLSFIASALDMARYGLWFACLLLLLRPALTRAGAPERSIGCPSVFWIRPSMLVPVFANASCPCVCRSYSACCSGLSVMVEVHWSLSGFFVKIWLPYGVT